MSVQLLIALTAASISLTAAELPPPSSTPVDFERDIRPLFAERCYACHGEAQQTSGLRLDRTATATTTDLR